VRIEQAAQWRSASADALFWCIVRAWTSLRGKPPQIKMPPGACFLYSEAGTHLAMALKPGETPCHRARSGRLFPSQSGRLRGALASTLKSPAEVKYGCHWRVRSLPQFPTAVGLQAAPRIARPSFCLASLTVLGEAWLQAISPSALRIPARECILGIAPLIHQMRIPPR
jgi:hypothetical protein